MTKLLVVASMCLLAGCSEPCKVMFEEGTVVKDKLTGYKAVVTDTARSSENDKGYCLIDVVWEYSSYTDIYVNPARFTRIHN